MIFLTALAKVLPIFLLILLGVALRRLRVIRSETVADLKKLVVTVTLPAMLFLAFSQVAIKARYLAIVVIMLGACWLVLLLGCRLGPPLRLPSPFMPSLLTGFEAGMMGYAIFGAAYGQESIYKFGIIDLGQVLFVFFTTPLVALTIGYELQFRPGDLGRPLRTVGVRLAVFSFSIVGQIVRIATNTGRQIACRPVTPFSKRLYRSQRLPKSATT